MEEKKQNPELRFTGFKEDWKEHRLGDLIDITSAARVHKNEWTKSGIPFFRSSDVVSDYKGNDNTKAYISQELYDELSNKIGKVQKNDLLVTGGGSIGIPYLIKNDNPLYFKDADLLWLKNGNKINGQFLYEFFLTKTFRKYVEKITHIGTISHYTVEQAKDTPISLPCPAEQERLGSFIADVNKLIQTHQKKHNRLVTLKKSMLEKMFPKEGQTVPEIRFKGFEGDWEEHEFQEIATLRRGLTYSPSDVQNTGTRVLRSSNIIENRFVKRDDDVFVIDEAIKIDYVKEGDILITAANGSSNLVGKHALVTGVFGKVVHGGFMLLASSKTPLFLNASMSSSWYKKFVNLYTAGGGGSIGNLSKSDLDQQILHVPGNEREQIKIGEYFHSIDILISKHLDQLKKLTSLKQSLLEKMFV